MIPHMPLNVINIYYAIINYEWMDLMWHIV